MQPEVRIEQWVSFRFKDSEVNGSNLKLNRLTLSFFIYYLPQKGWILKNPVEFGLKTNLKGFYIVYKRFFVEPYFI